MSVGTAAQNSLPAGEGPTWTAIFASLQFKADIPEGWSANTTTGRNSIDFFNDAAHIYVFPCSKDVTDVQTGMKEFADFFRDHGNVKGSTPTPASFPGGKGLWTEDASADGKYFWGVVQRGSDVYCASGLDRKGASAPFRDAFFTAFRSVQRSR